MSSSDPSSPQAIPVSGETRRAGSPAQPSRVSLAGGLYIVSTPIGNLRDITLRALDVLASADEVLAEDTRNTRRLLDAHGISAKLSAYHDHSGAGRRDSIVEKLAGGAAIALVSDAGTPLVSDPGLKLVRACIRAEVDVFPIPGASALLAGLVTSGLPSDRFLFCGFLPAKSGARARAITELASIPATLVFYETGPRLAASLATMAETLGGDRQAVVSRELTKLFEEARRGTLSNLSEHYEVAGAPKGEIVILVEAAASETASDADLVAALTEALTRLPVKAAADEVAAALSLSRRQVYQRALQLKSVPDG